MLGLTICGLMILGCSGKVSQHGGVQNGMLSPCPAKPNCVGSQAEGERHKIEPIHYAGGKSAAFDKLKKIVISLERAGLVEENDDYLRFEFKSALFGFVDDVEFYFPEEPVIHVRSASRLGYSDFGVNRKRIEKVRRLFDGR